MGAPKLPSLKPSNFETTNDKTLKRTHEETSPSPKKVNTRSKKGKTTRLKKTDQPEIVKRLKQPKKPILDNSIKRQILKLSETIAKLSSELSILKSSVENINSNQRQSNGSLSTPFINYEKEFPRLSLNLHEQGKTKAPSLIEAKIMCGITAHNHDREKRENNIIIMGATEPTNCNDRDKEALNFTGNLFSFLKVDPLIIKSCKRLRAVGPYPGIIKVRLSSKEARDNTLKIARKLRATSSYKSHYNGVYINPDLTREERLVEMSAIKDMKNLNEKRTDEDKKHHFFSIRNMKVAKVMINANHKPANLVNSLPTPLMKLKLNNHTAMNINTPNSSKYQSSSKLSIKKQNLSEEQPIAMQPSIINQTNQLLPPATDQINLPSDNYNNSIAMETNTTDSEHPQESHEPLPLTKTADEPTVITTTVQ